MPILNQEGKLPGILGNLLDEASTPVIAKIDVNKVGSCFTIQNFNNIPNNFCPDIPLMINTVRDTVWENAMNEIVLCTLPAIVPIPFGVEIKSCNYNDAFINKLQKILKIIKFIEKTKSKTWMRDNKDAIAHLPMVFMGKIHQLFQHLASFS